MGKLVLCRVLQAVEYEDGLEVGASGFTLLMHGLMVCV